MRELQGDLGRLIQCGALKIEPRRSTRRANSSSALVLGCEEITNGRIGKTEAARIAAVARGAWGDIHLAWVPQTFHGVTSHGRSFQPHGHSRLFRLHRRSAGILWRDFAHAGVVYAGHRVAARGGDGGRSG